MKTLTLTLLLLAAPAAADPPSWHHPDPPHGHAYGHDRTGHSEVPEPVTGLLFGAGLLALAWLGRR